jgi:hypothetical protein
MTSGGPTSLKKALSWYYGEDGPVYFKNASAGYYKGMDDIRSVLPGIFQEVLTVPGLIFQINTLGGAISSDVEGAYPHRAYPYLGESQAYWESASQQRLFRDAIGRMRNHVARRGHKPLRELSRSCVRRLANGVLRRRKLCASSN